MRDCSSLQVIKMIKTGKKTEADRNEIHSIGFQLKYHPKRNSWHCKKNALIMINVI